MAEPDLFRSRTAEAIRVHQRAEGCSVRQRQRAALPKARVLKSLAQRVRVQRAPGQGVYPGLPNPTADRSNFAIYLLKSKSSFNLLQNRNE